MIRAVARRFSKQVEVRLGKPAYRPPMIVWIPAIMIGLGMILPVVYLLVRSFGVTSEGWHVLVELRTLYTLGRTVLLAITVMFGSLAIALPIAWLTVRTDLPMRRLWSVVTVLPLVIPSYVGAFLFISALGPKGLMQEWLPSFLGVERLPDIYGLAGATFTLVLLSYPYLLLTIRGAWSNLDPSTEESARSLGHGALGTIFRVTLPQLHPAIASGLVLVTLYTISDFGAVSLMRYQTFTWVIFQHYESSFDYSIAAVLSLVLILVAIVILALEGSTRNGLRYYRTGLGVQRMPTVVNLGRWRWPAVALCAVVVGLSLLLPMLVLGIWLFKGVLSGEPLLILWAATRNSIMASGMAAAVAAVLAIPLGILTVRYPGKFSLFLERISFTGYALPGVVVALALVFFGANYVPIIYQTIWLLVFAYVVLFFPAAFGATRASLHQVSPSLEEAARGLGMNTRQVISGITVPLVRSGVLMGAVLVFLIAMKELPATLILSPLGFETLATAVWSASSEAFFARAAAPALTLILISSLPMAYLVSLEKKPVGLNTQGYHG